KRRLLVADLWHPSKMYLMKTVLLFISLVILSAASDPYSTMEVETETFQATNVYRKKKGRETLQMDTFLCQLAREHSENMAKKKVGFGHDGLKDRTKRVEAALGTGNIAENVFYASYEATGQDAVDSWINSKGHRLNMLGKNYK